LNVPDDRYLTYELKTMDGIPMYCLHTASYPGVAVNQWEMTHRLHRFYILVNLNLGDMSQHMQESDFAINAESLYNLAMNFVQKEPRNSDHQ